MTNAELLALLSEAREGHCTSWRFRCGLCARIDAALAEAEKPVAWTAETEVAHNTRVGEWALGIGLSGGGRWTWTVSATGKADELDEAKSAAIRAARGM